MRHHWQEIRCTGLPIIRGGAVRDRVKVDGHVGGAGERDRLGKYPVKADIAEILGRVRQRIDVGLTVIKISPLMPWRILIHLPS